MHGMFKDMCTSKKNQIYFKLWHLFDDIHVHLLSVCVCVNIQTGGNRVFDGDVDDEVLGFGNFDGDRTATFRDMDGSVTKCPGDANWQGPMQIVKPEKYIITERCKYRANHNMVMCNDLYGKVSIVIYVFVMYTTFILTR